MTTMYMMFLWSCIFCATCRGCGEAFYVLLLVTQKRVGDGEDYLNIFVYADRREIADMLQQGQ